MRIWQRFSRNQLSFIAQIYAVASLITAFLYITELPDITQSAVFYVVKLHLNNSDIFIINKKRNDKNTSSLSTGTFCSFIKLSRNYRFNYILQRVIDYNNRYIYVINAQRFLIHRQVFVTRLLLMFWLVIRCTRSVDRKLWTGPILVKCRAFSVKLNRCSCTDWTLWMKAWAACVSEALCC